MFSDKMEENIVAYIRKDISTDGLNKKILEKMVKGQILHVFGFNDIGELKKHIGSEIEVTNKYSVTLDRNNLTYEATKL